LASNLVFDPSKLESAIDASGIRAAWTNILATHVATKGPQFEYILQNRAFDDHEILDEDLIGKLSIGEIGVLYEYSVAYVDAGSRKDNGQFFTPDDVAILMARKSLEFDLGVWLDPCSGIGNLSWHLVNTQVDRESFLLNNMILSDRDPLALFIARVLFTISFQEECENLFDLIESRFIEFDFLSVSGESQNMLFGSDSLDAIPKHDYVIVNPPYLSIKGADARFETAKCRDLYAYFMENIIKTSRGFISITPQSFTNASKFESLRNLLLKHFSNLTIYTFDNIPGNIFSGVKFGSSNSNTANSIRAAIVIAGANSDEPKRRITSLLRWRTSEREEFFGRLDDYLSDAPLSQEYFPKVSSVFLGLFKSLRKLPTLDSILSSEETDHVLYIPAAPRYFISALKTPVSRNSLKSIYFRNSKDLNKAYLLMNSSFMYWWWRVRDGGMTLSFETIKSLPLLDFDTDSKLVAKLEKSEKSNLVYKKNAGVMQENVKHDMTLIAEVNQVVSPKYAKKLLLTHENSDLVQIPRKKQ
jgi:hypothetical protein